MKLHLGNLPKNLTDAEVKDLIVPFAEPGSLEVIRNEAGESKGFGFAEFADDAHAKAVIAGLDGKDVGGQTLKIGESGLAFFTVTNNSDHPLTGRAAYNVAPDQAGVLQNLQMLGDRGLGHREARRDLARRQIDLGKIGEDFAAGRRGQGFEDLFHAS